MSSISSISSARPQPLDPSEFFKKADANGSGGINKAELAEMLKNRPTPPGGEASGAEATTDIDKIFEEVDTDGNGEISEAENQAHMEEMAKNGPGDPAGFSGSSDTFDQLVDALKNSGLSGDDLDSMLKEWVAQLKEKGTSSTLFSTQA